MSYIKIEIPQKGNVYLVSKDFSDDESPSQCRGYLLK